jgi:hypothetical protein
MFQPIASYSISSEAKKPPIVKGSRCDRYARRTLLYAMTLLATASVQVTAQSTPTIVVQWNNAALQGVRDSKIGPPMVARALFIVHNCIYDAWAAYDQTAVGTVFGGTLRRPISERTLANKNQAMSFAAYRAAIDLFPSDKGSVFDPLMANLGYNINDNSTNPATPAGIGNLTCRAILAIRHNDGSNQLGNMTATGVAYADYTGYVPVNPAITGPLGPGYDYSSLDPNHWQPLTYFNGTTTVTPSFVGAQWYKVTPFALKSADEFLSFITRFGPAVYPSQTYLEQAQALVAISARLTDKQKIIAEYWANGPHTELPPGHWDLFAQFVSARDRHTVDDDAKMFFALTAAIHDAGIAAWAAKSKFDSVRPVTAIPFSAIPNQVDLSRRLGLPRLRPACFGVLPAVCQSRRSAQPIDHKWCVVRQV